MLKLYNKEHEAIGVLTNLKDYRVEYVLSGEDLVEFSLSISDENIYLVEEEGYVRTKDNEYVIKAIDPSDNFKRFSCNVNIEALVGKAIASFDTSNNNVNDTIRLAIAGTGWILADNNITKRRTVRLTNTNALEVLREVRKVFRVDFRYDAINKIIYVYEQFGEERGVYFSDELNLKSFSIPSDTYDYVTRLYPKGKDGLTIASINNGKEYIENFQYSNKVLELIWEDNRYTDVNSLKEDAEFKLDELSKPKRSYQASISDLAKQSEEYNFLDFFLGDTITLLSKQEKFRDKQRIVKYIQYPNDSSQNSCELGNTTLTFEELQKENEAKNNTVDAITSDNGTINGSKVDSITTEQISDFEVSVAKITDLTVVNAEINNLKAQNVTITGELNAVKGEFGTLKANVGVIDNLTVTHTAQINNLEATKASITQLEAVSAIIGTVEAEVGKIQTLVNGNLSSENIQAGGITSDKLTIANGFITNAMIASLDVSKVNAGDISTNKFRIKSDDGGIEIVGATQQFKDKNNKVRVQIGKDTQGNFNFIIKGEDGTTTLIDHTGVKAGAIADNLIISDMIANDAVGEKQINYSSFVTGFNKDTNTSTIKSTKIMLNNQNQTLDVAFNSLKTQADGTKSITESHSTTIGVMQGQISTAINNTKIVKDGQTILLKDDYNRTVQTVNSINSTLGSHTTQINEATGKITGVETRVNSVERNLDSITARVSSTESTTTTLNNRVNAAQSTADTAKSTADQAKTTAINAQNTANTANATANANKTEIASTKSKVSEIKTDLSGITNRVSSAETNIEKISSASSQNLLYNSDFRIMNGSFPDGWSVSDSSKIVLDQNGTLLDGIPTFWFNVTGFTANAWKAVYSPFVEAKQGEKFVASVYVKGYNNWSALDSGGHLEIEYYNDSSRLTTSSVSINKSNLNWQRLVVKGTAPSGTTKVRIRVHPDRNGQFNMSKPMLQYGETVTGWDRGFDIKNLTTRLKSAENKITESAIISTVSTEFYKKGETDNKYASQTQITQLSNQISSKVDVNGVKTVIQQNPESVMIGFNNISDSFLVNEHGLLCNNTNGNKSIAIQKGNLYYYNQYDNSKFLGGIIPRITTSDYLKGFGVLASKHCNTFQISHTDQWDNDSQWEIPGTIYPDFWINYKDITSNRGDLKGIHLGMTTYADNNILGNQSNSISGFNSISATSMCYDHWRSLVDNSIVARFDGGTNKILLGKNLNGNGFILENFASVNVSKIYLDSVYAYNGNYGKILFRTDGWNMYNGVNWDWQGYNILSPNIIGGSYGYSATLSSTRSYKTSIDTSSILDCINIVEPINTFSKSSKSSLEMDISQLINHPNADMFIYRNTNNVDMKSMLHLALLEIQKLKKEVQEIRAS
ncbi:phage tail spike protein [Romboutsia ilealis]|uniref:phage tail spike protein n=1 Tax=Romboutsia ilealis TaxID=1115758 RepID=UPI002572299E|nr:phage tail spike protein [Romboutsia ilealis]